MNIINKLHADIMNLLCFANEEVENPHLAFKIGHKEARHSAAEMIVSSDELRRIVLDAARYNILKARGVCDNKHGNGFTLGSRDKASVAFRYWCESDELDKLIVIDESVVK
jgi:hypothetical protein